MISDRSDGFGAAFSVQLDVGEVWERLTASPSDTSGGFWLPGFDGTATVIDSRQNEFLLLRKDTDPCGGSRIEFTLCRLDAGASVEVSQTEFGDWFEPMRSVLRPGWRHLAADIETFLATGVHPARHMRRWGDLGAEALEVSGGVRIGRVREAGLASGLMLRPDDLLVVLAGAPVSNLDDLATVLRVLGPDPEVLSAEVVRDGRVVELSMRS